MPKRSFSDICDNVDMLLNLPYIGKANQVDAISIYAKTFLTLWNIFSLIIVHLEYFEILKIRNGE